MPDRNRSDRIIRYAELKQIVGFSRMQIWRLEQSGHFPKRIRLAPGRNARVGWSLSEIYEFIEEKKAERQDEYGQGHSSRGDD